MYQKENIDYSKIYSPYKLNLFEECPKQYSYNYLDPEYKSIKYNLQKKPENIWPFQTLGSAVHDAITLFYHHPPESQNRGLLLKCLEETWRNFDNFKNYNKMPLEWRGGFQSLEEERKYYRRAQELLDNFYKMRNPHWKIFYLPTRNFRNSIKDYKELIQPLTGQYDLSGKFDLIIEEEEGLHIIDFKTGKKENGNSFQLKFYKVLAEKNFNQSVSKTSYFYLKESSKQEKQAKKYDNKKIEQTILNKIKTIKEETKFNPKPSKLCHYCLFRKLCPEGTEINTKHDKRTPGKLPF